MSMHKNGAPQNGTKCPIPPSMIETMMSTATAKTLEKLASATSPVASAQVLTEPLLRDIEKLKNAASARRYKAETARRKNRRAISEARNAELYAITFCSYMKELTTLLDAKECDWTNQALDVKEYYDTRKKGGALENISKYLHTGVGGGFFIISIADLVDPFAKLLQDIWVHHPQVIDAAHKTAEQIARFCDNAIKAGLYLLSAAVAIGLGALVKLIVTKVQRSFNNKEQKDVDVFKTQAKLFGSALGKDATERALVLCCQYGYYEQLDAIPEGRKYREVLGEGMDAVWKVYGATLKKITESLPASLKFLMHTPTRQNGGAPSQ